MDTSFGRERQAEARIYAYIQIVIKRGRVAVFVATDDCNIFAIPGYKAIRPFEGKCLNPEWPEEHEEERRALNLHTDNRQD